MDRGAWWATVHEVAKSQTRLSKHTQDSIGNYSHYLVITCSGKEYVKEHVSVYLNHFAVHQKLTLSITYISIFLK